MIRMGFVGWRRLCWVRNAAGWVRGGLHRLEVDAWIELQSFWMSSGWGRSTGRKFMEWGSPWPHGLNRFMNSASVYVRHSIAHSPPIPIICSDSIDSLLTQHTTAEFGDQIHIETNNSNNERESIRKPTDYFIHSAMVCASPCIVSFIHELTEPFDICIMTRTKEE